MMIKKTWNYISELGVKPEMPIFEQKSINLMNQLAITGIPITIFLGYALFVVYNIGLVGLTLWFNSFLFLLVLFLNSKGFTTVSKFILSTIPVLLLTFASAYAKSQGSSATVMFYINPRMGIIIIYSLSLFLFGFEKFPRFFLGISVSVSCFVFFDFIHQLFGVYIQDLPYVKEEFPSLIISTGSLLLFIGIGVVLVQRINMTYEEKVKIQSKEIENQRDQLLEKNEEIVFQKKEIESQRDNVIKLNEEMKLQQKALEEINEDVRDSILYAQRIQQAILPTQSQIESVLPESFVVFKPRDIVSGDFYYFAEKGTKVIVAAIDCTGHGVPGAFMSMIGNDILDQIIHDKEIHEADKILNELHKGIRKALKQQESENRDGMDIALIVFHKDQHILEFAGAKNPLVYIQNGEIFEIKGDKMPVGGEQKEEERIFTKHRIHINQKDSMFYLFSDGYHDQFGGNKNKKFMLSNLKNLLVEIHRLPMEVQKQTLEQTIENWILEGNEKQIDDILLIGLKL